MDLPTETNAAAQDSLAALLRWFSGYRWAAVAYSAGADSTLVLKAAVLALGPQCVFAITADSPSLARSEFQIAQQTAREFGVRHIVVQTAELANPAYAQNDHDRCYHCKSAFYAAASHAANELLTDLTAGAAGDHALHAEFILADGTNADDFQDIRPGLRAAEEAGIRHPLADCGIGKDGVRQISAVLGLPTWNKPEAACLASRIVSGIPVTLQNLAMVEKAERCLKDRGFLHVRVRYHESAKHGPLARIELDPGDIALLCSPGQREQVVAELKHTGFSYVVLDLEGYKKGGRAVPDTQQGQQ